VKVRRLRWLPGGVLLSLAAASPLVACGEKSGCEAELSCDGALGGGGSDGSGGDDSGAEAGGGPSGGRGASGGRAGTGGELLGGIPEMGSGGLASGGLGSGGGVVLPPPPLPGLVLRSGETAFRLHRGESAELSVSVTPTGGLSGEVTVLWEGLPAGVIGEAAVVEDGGGTLQLALAVGQSAAEGGPFPYRVLAQGPSGAEAELRGTLIVAGLPGAVDTSFAEQGLLQDEYFGSRAFVQFPDGMLGVSGASSNCQFRRLSREGSWLAEPAPGPVCNWTSYFGPLFAHGDGALWQAPPDLLAGPTKWFRFGPDGQADSAFGIGGVVDLGEAYPAHVASAPDGTLYFYESQHAPPLWSLTPDGTLNETFVFSGSEAPSVLATDGSGRLLVGSGDGLRRYLGDGSLDESFGAGGLASWLKGSSPQAVTRVTVDSWGRIYVVLSGSGTFLELAAVDDHGMPDTGFGSVLEGSEGRVSYGIARLRGIVRLYPLGDGSLLVAQTDQVLSDESAGKVDLQRLTHLGNPFPGWGSEGVVSPRPLGEGDFEYLSIAVDTEVGHVAFGGKPVGSYSTVVQRIWL
jgi:hypothetical protein